jgi:hypothetical protein
MQRDRDPPGLDVVSGPRGCGREFRPARLGGEARRLDRDLAFEQD